MFPADVAEGGVEIMRKAIDAAARDAELIAEADMWRKFSPDETV